MHAHLDAYYLKVAIWLLYFCRQATSIHFSARTKAVETGGDGTYIRKTKVFPETPNLMLPPIPKTANQSHAIHPPLNLTPSHAQVYL